MIDPRDVGAAAAVHAHDAGLRPRGLRRSPAPRRSPTRTWRPSSRPPRAATWSSSTSPTTTRATRMIEAGVPAFVAEQIVAIFARRGRASTSEVTGTVESLTGRPARDFAAFAREHAGLFAPVAEAAAAMTPPPTRSCPPRLRGRDPGGRPGRDARPGRARTSSITIRCPGSRPAARVPSTSSPRMHGAHPDLRFAIDDLWPRTTASRSAGRCAAPAPARSSASRRRGQPVELSAIVIFRIADGRLAERWAGWKRKPPEGA